MTDDRSPVPSGEVVLEVQLGAALDALRGVLGALITDATLITLGKSDPAACQLDVNTRQDERLRLR